MIHQVNVDVCISAIQTNPAAVNHFEEQKIISVAAGDEFSLALDARWYPWGWGRAEHGQVCPTLHMWLFGREGGVLGVDSIANCGWLGNTCKMLGW